MGFSASASDALSIARVELNVRNGRLTRQSIKALSHGKDARADSLDIVRVTA